MIEHLKLIRTDEFQVSFMSGAILLVVEVSILAVLLPAILRFLENRKFKEPRHVMYKFLVRIAESHFHAYAHISQSIFEDRDLQGAISEFHRHNDLMVVGQQYIHTMSFSIDRHFAKAISLIMRRRRRILKDIILLGADELEVLDADLDDQLNLRHTESHNKKGRLREITEVMNIQAKLIGRELVRLDSAMRKRGYGFAVPEPIADSVITLGDRSSIRRISKNIIGTAISTGNLLCTKLKEQGQTRA